MRPGPSNSPMPIVKIGMTSVFACCDRFLDARRGLVVAAVADQDDRLGTVREGTGRRAQVIQGDEERVGHVRAVAVVVRIHARVQREVVRTAIVNLREGHDDRGAVGIRGVELDHGRMVAVDHLGDERVDRVLHFGFKLVHDARAVVHDEHDRHALVRVQRRRQRHVVGGDRDRLAVDQDGEVIFVERRHRVAVGVRDLDVGLDGPAWPADPRRAVPRPPTPAPQTSRPATSRQRKSRKPENPARRVSNKRIHVHPCSKPLGRYCNRLDS